MRYHFGLGVGHLHAHMSTSSYRSMSVDAQDEPVPESLPIGGDVRTTDVADDGTENDQDGKPGVAEGSDNYDGHEPRADLEDNASQSDNSELGLDERDIEGWEDVESDGGSDLDDDRGSVDEDEEEFGGI
jgi:hypothetical protein